MFKRKRLVLIFLAVLVLGIIFLAGSLWQNYVPPIIMYHSVSPEANPENRLAVSVESFQRQMRFLKNHQYNVITLEALADLIKSRKKIPAKTIVITFDDGYKDNFIYAFPILNKYNLPATVFLIIDEIGRPQGDRLSWEEIRLMQSSGIINFGSHTIGPEPLTNIRPEEELRRQIFDSKLILEEKLGCPVNTFSYPEGSFNDHIRKLVIDAGYKVAVATKASKHYPDNDIFALKRLRISSTSDNLFIFWVETSGYYVFLREYKYK